MCMRRMILICAFCTCSKALVRLTRPIVYVPFIPTERKIGQHSIITVIDVYKKHCKLVSGLNYPWYQLQYALKVFKINRR